MKHHRKHVAAATGLAAIVALVATALFVVPALATPPSGLTNTPLARGTNTSHGTLPLQGGTDIVMAQITVDPGGSSGWHSHPGGAIVVVTAGHAHHLPIRRQPLQCHHVQRGAGVHRAIRGSRPGRQHRHDPICPVRHLPACASGRLREN